MDICGADETTARFTLASVSFDLERAIDRHLSSSMADDEDSQAPPPPPPPSVQAEVDSAMESAMQLSVSAGVDDPGDISLEDSAQVADLVGPAETPRNERAGDLPVDVGAPQLLASSMMLVDPAPAPASAPALAPAPAADQVSARPVFKFGGAPAPTPASAAAPDLAPEREPELQAEADVETADDAAALDTLEIESVGSADGGSGSLLALDGAAVDAAESLQAPPAVAWAGRDNDDDDDDEGFVNAAQLGTAPLPPAAASAAAVAPVAETAADPVLPSIGASAGADGGGGADDGHQLGK